jgi:hypothetical protein
MLANKKLLWVGLCGIAIAAVSWLTPLLVVVLDAIGLSLSRPWIDTAMAVALAIFIGLTMYALVRMGRLKIVSGGCCGVLIPEELRIPPVSSGAGQAPAPNTSLRFHGIGARVR